jgi:hypothetical protein
MLDLEPLVVEIMFIPSTLLNASHSCLERHETIVWASALLFSMAFQVLCFQISRVMGVLKRSGRPLALSASH